MVLSGLSGDLLDGSAADKNRILLSDRNGAGAVEPFVFGGSEGAIAVCGFGGRGLATAPVPAAAVVSLQ